MASSDGLKGVERSINSGVEWAWMTAYADECKQHPPTSAAERRLRAIAAANRVLAVANQRLDEATASTYPAYEDEEVVRG